MEISTSNSKGSLTISEEVISSIATNAAKDVDGVSSFSNRPADVVNTIKKGSLKVMSPVRILQDGDNISVSIYVNLQPNKKIQAVAKNVQNNVKEAIQNMTGKSVSNVNVVIVGIDFDESEDSSVPNQTEEN